MRGKAADDRQYRVISTARQLLEAPQNMSGRRIILVEGERFWMLLAGIQPSPIVAHTALHIARYLYIFKHGEKHLQA